MTATTWLALGGAGYLAAGVWTCYAIWRWHGDSPTCALEGWGSVVATVVYWPVPCCILLSEVSIPPPPTYEEWKERRREAAERRTQPSEAVPYQGAKL